MSFLIAILLLIAAWFIWAAMRAAAAPPPAARRDADFLDDQPAHRPATFRAAEDMKTLYPVNVKLALQYKSASEEATRRIVSVQEYSTDPPGYLFGHCHLRDEIRTFRLDRIESATAVDSGEIIGNLRDYLLQAYERSPVAAWSALMSEHILALRALVYVAKADGTFSTKERDVLAEHCQQLLSREDLTRPDMNKALRALPATTPVAFRQVVGQLAHYPEAYRSRIVQTARAIVGTQRTATPAEAEALAMLEDRLSAAQH